MRHVSDSFARPADTDAYAAQDEVSTTTVAGTTAPLQFEGAARAKGGDGWIVKAVLECSSPTVANGVFRLWLFNAAPTMFGDNAAYQLDAADIAKRVAYVDLALITEGTGSDAAYALDDGLRTAFKCAADSRDLWGVLVAKGAYVPTSGETFTVTLVTDDD